MLWLWELLLLLPWSFVVVIVVVEVWREGLGKGGGVVIQDSCTHML